MEQNQYEKLEIGQHVVFHDDRQQEISGTVIGKHDYPDYIQYLLELDGGVIYYAKLIKQQKVERVFRHEKNIVPISYNSAYFKCSCGWESRTAYANDERIPHYQDAENDFKNHIIEAMINDN